MIDGNAFGMLTLLIVVANVVVHVALASAVWTDSHALEQQGHKLAFFGPYLWTVTVAISGIVAAGFYWIMHHSTLSPMANEDGQEPHD
jgi:hypothetical protein